MKTPQFTDLFLSSLRKYSSLSSLASNTIIFIARCAWILIVSLQICTAATYPNKPITLIVPTAAGGPVDLTSRIVAQETSRLLGQVIVLENRPGANQKIGLNVMLRSPKDGYTISAISPASMILGPIIDPKMGYDPLKDITLITCAVNIPIVLIVHPSVPVQNIKEFITYAKANPEKISYGSGGPGTRLHFSSEGFFEKLGIHALHVPYNSSAPALTGLLSKQVSFLMPDLAGAKGQIDAGKVIALAVLGSKRVEALPNVPTLLESGVPELKDYNYNTWVGFGVANGVPSDIVEKLRKTMIEALNSPKVQEAFKQAGYQIVGSNSSEFQTQVEYELNYNKKLLESGAVKLE
jgi:tripartite-type tricarboxylate transporter receptor subunit TctC